MKRNTNIIIGAIVVILVVLLLGLATRRNKDAMYQSNTNVVPSTVTSNDPVDQELNQLDASMNDAQSSAESSDSQDPTAGL